MADKEWPVFETVEMHTGGEPVRIIETGYPDIPGGSILAKRRYVRDNLDHFRKALMFEPRGHYDMYGVIPVPPSHPEAHLAVLFTHNEGYSTMCGHATIALGRYAIDKGLVPVIEPVTTVNIECPCGLVRAHVQVEKGVPGQVSFDSVPAFAFALSRLAATPTYGPVEVDIAYGGAFYALAPADTFGLDVRKSRTRDLVDAATEVTEAVKAQIPLHHPDDPDLAFLYGTILTDGNDEFSAEPTANICVFADAQVDRSPTGSGVTARIAAQAKRGQIKPGQQRLFESVTGCLFTGEIAEETRCGDFPAVRARVSGQSYYTGRSQFTIEAEDPLAQGFLLK